MGLKLHDVAPARGPVWVRDGLRLFARKPGAFIGLFAFFMVGLVLVMAIPVVGPYLCLALPPLLTLGFLIAARSTLAGGPVLPTQLIDGLRGPDGPSARNQWRLCALHGALAIVTTVGAHLLDGGAFERLLNGMSKATPEQMAALTGDPWLVPGLLIRGIGLTLLSVAFWFAPALVYWGGQGSVQSIFSSLLSVWRAKGAFLQFGLIWLGLFGGLTLALFVLGLVGWRMLGTLIGMAGYLALSAAFFVSLWYGWVDCFGDGDATRMPGRPE